MLYFYFEKIRENKIVKKINDFIYTPWYMLSIAIIMAMANVFGLEFMSFYAYLLICLYVALFAPDCFPLAPIVCCCYMLFSAGNNPAADYGQTIFDVPANKIQFIAIVVILGLTLLSRFLFEVLVVKRKTKGMPALTFGFIALGIAYLLSGIGTNGYGGQELLFAFVEILSLCITYFYFYYTVDWGKRSKSDCVSLLIAIGVGLFLEIIGMYIQPEVIQAIKEGKFHRGLLRSGWGVYNNVGGMMAMFMPVPFYFACVKKKGWLYILLASVFFMGVVLSQSRGAMLSGGMMYVIGCVFVAVYTPKKRRLGNMITLSVIASAIVIVAVVVLLNPENSIMSSIINAGIKDSGRFQIYEIGLKQFFDSPIFGKGFYAPIDDAGKYFDVLSGHQYGWEKLEGTNFFLPPRYHNTIVQLLACGGIVAMIAYLFHRVQTLLLCLKKPSAYKIFLGLAVSAHLLASLLDCHFFNLGPGLTYGFILLCMEMFSVKREKKPQGLKREKNKEYQ